jgi:photosystem II stability/assembly factor-like uncharacterized protein
MRAVSSNRNVTQFYLRTSLLSLSIFLHGIYISAQINMETTPGSLKMLYSPQLVNIRGMSIVSDNCVWLSGTQGWVGKAEQKKDSVHWKQVAGFERFDFRAVHAVSEQEACIVNAGSPAYILKTMDGGEHWNVVYRNRDSLAFLDAIAFWDKQRGIVVGDPVNTHFVILVTADGGNTWEYVPPDLCPVAELGEACFAASGTCLQVDSQGNAWIGTGGSHARLLHSADYGRTWKSVPAPMIQGKASQGIFSVAMQDRISGLVAGGDYAKDSLTEGNCLLTNDGGLHWERPSIPPGGYISCVSWYSRNGILGTGTKGSYFSPNEGKTWSLLDKTSFNVCGYCPQAGILFLGGEKGKVGMLKTGYLMPQQRENKR